MIPNEYASAVFINCPFDVHYKPIFEGIVFGIMDCGYWPRCALERRVRKALAGMASGGTNGKRAKPRKKR